MFATHPNLDATMLDGDDWRTIDRELRSVAKRQRALDAEEAALLCVVSRQQTWREFGCATMLEYLEMIFGYGPKIGYERVRVALAIDALPELRDALANGDISYSALREITRVVTADTQREWLAEVRGESDADRGRAKYQIRVTKCDSCLHTYFEGGGRKIAVNDADAARAECDAQRIGADQRATQDVAPKTRRDVLHRDGGKCTVPRCRSARFIEVHHIVPRSEGGSHDASNLTELCFAHHAALHEHKLVISGSAPNITVQFVNDAAVETSVTPKTTHVEARHVENHATARHVEVSPSSKPARQTDAQRPAIPHVETQTVVQHLEAKPTEIVPAHPAFAADQDPSGTDDACDRTPTRAEDVSRVAVDAIPQLGEPKLLHLVETSAISHVETPATRAAAGHDDATTPRCMVTTPSSYAIAVMRTEAKQALQQLGFSSPISTKCVDSALAHQPTPSTLEELIRLALRCSR